MCPNRVTGEMKDVFVYIQCSGWLALENSWIRRIEILCCHTCANPYIDVSIGILTCSVFKPGWFWDSESFKYLFCKTVHDICITVLKYLNLAFIAFQTVGMANVTLKVIQAEVATQVSRNTTGVRGCAYQCYKGVQSNVSNITKAVVNFCNTWMSSML